MKRTEHPTAVPLKSSLLPIIFLFLAIAGYSQTIPTASKYLGQQVPGITPKIFTLQVTPGLAAAERITISADNREIYYGELNNWPASSQRIKCYQFNGSAWTGPFVVFEGFIAPCLSSNDSIMYMQKMLNNNTLVCSYYSLRTSTGWTTPQRLLSMNRHAHYFQETDLRNYFTASSTATASSVADLYKLNIRNGDSSLQSLGIPMNTSATENDFFIARDESYIILCRFNSGSASDLYISYKTENGRWTNPKTLGAQVNTPNPNWEACPFVTKDNKYLFFMRGGNALSSYYIYWVAIDNLIDSLRQTNFQPYVRFSLQNQTFKSGRSNTFTISDSSFIDDNGNHTLTYSASLGNGNPLPAWLSFDADSMRLTGIPDQEGSYPIKILVTDPTGATAFSSFTLRIIDASGTDDQLLEQKVHVFPNPSKGKFTVSLGDVPFQEASIRIINLAGREVFYFDSIDKQSIDIDLDINSPGVYFMILMIDGVRVNKKVILY